MATKRSYVIGVQKVVRRISVYSKTNHGDLQEPEVTYTPDIEAFGKHANRLSLLRRFLAFAEPEMASTIADTCPDHIKRVAAPYFRGKNSIYKVLRID